MDYITLFDSMLFVIFYLVLTCGSAYRIASYESGLAVKVPDQIRVWLLIFSFKWPKISILAVVYQIYTYVMLSFFLISRVSWMQTYLKEKIPNINLIYTRAFWVQTVGLFLIALAEEGVYYLLVVRKRRR